MVLRIKLMQNKTTKQFSVTLPKKKILEITRKYPRKPKYLILDKLDWEFE